MGRNLVFCRKMPQNPRKRVVFGTLGPIFTVFEPIFPPTFFDKLGLPPTFFGHKPVLPTIKTVGFFHKSGQKPGFKNKLGHGLSFAISAIKLIRPSLAVCGSIPMSAKLTANNLNYHRILETMDKSMFDVFPSRKPFQIWKLIIQLITIDVVYIHIVMIAIVKRISYQPMDIIVLFIQPNSHVSVRPVKRLSKYPACSSIAYLPGVTDFIIRMIPNFFPKFVHTSFALRSIERSASNPSGYLARSLSMFI